MRFHMRQSRWKIFGGGALFLVALVAAGIALRKPLAGWAAETYLARLGIPASIKVTRLNLSGLSAGLHIGPAQAGISAERIDIDLARLALKPELAAVHILRPTARFTYTQDGLALGPLQRLVDNFAGETGASSTPAIPVTIEGAVITLDTQAGSLILRGDAVFLGDALKRLDVSASDATLRLGAMAGQVRELQLRVMEAKSGLSISARAVGALSFQTTHGPVTLEGLRVTTHAPRVGLSRTDDMIQINADGFEVSANADKAQILADTLQSLRLGLQDTRLTFARNAQGTSLSGSLTADFTAGGGDVSGLTVRKATAQLGGQGRFGNTAEFNVSVKSTIDAGLIPTRAQTAIAQMAALSAADRKTLSDILRAVIVDIPALTLSGDNGTITATLQQPITIAGGPVARATIAAPNDGPLLAMENGTARGAMRLAFAGSHLPTIDLTMSSYTFATEPTFAMSADAALTLRGNLAGLSGVSIVTGGKLSAQGQDFSYAARNCTSLAIADISPSGESVMRDAVASLCPRAGTDILRYEGGALRLTGLLSKVGALVPAAQTRISDAGGNFDLTRDPDGNIKGGGALNDALLSDANDTLRFSPVRISGDAQLRPDQWRAKFLLSSASKQQQLGTVTLSHAPRTGRGEAQLEVEGVTLAPDGLQPADIAPSLAAFESATGTLDFAGRFVWGQRGDMASEGSLGLHNLGFVSPAGAISGIRGALRFDSLFPLSSPPGQKLEISSIDWMMPITDAAVEFSFDAAKLQVTAVTAKMADGAVSVDPFTIDLGAEPVLNSTMRLQDIDLGPVVASTNFADRVQLAVKVEGVVPFSLAPSGIQFQKGALQSVGPGRLSISRALWTGPDQPPVNAVQDFAYQAMERLAVDELTGEINSLDQDRLGLVLRIKGRHDPVKPAVTELGLLPLLKGEAFNAPIPLPDKTPVDLTLDMSLNFGELLRAYGEAFGQLKNSVH